jgi:phosphohistidine phosphatase
MLPQRVSMRTLLLLRHAKSDWADAGQDDHERPLARRGVRAAERMGAHLAEAGCVPDLVLCSTARRAVETWRLAAAALGSDAIVELDSELYLASPARILERVQRAPDRCHTLLVVGHNPGFQELAVRLAGGSRTAAAERIGKFPTAALATFTLARGGWGELAPSGVRLAAFVRPSELD